MSDAFGVGIKTPIVLNDSGDVQMFDSVESVERYIEPIDAENLDCEVFDADGNLLVPEVVSEPKWPFGLAKLKRVVLTAANRKPASKRLTDVLEAFLSSKGIELPVERGLQDLIERARAVLRVDSVASDLKDRGQKGKWGQS